MKNSTKTKSSVINKMIDILNISNWQIKIQYGGEECKKTYGYNCYDLMMMESNIFIRKGIDIEEELLTIAHELVHLTNVELMILSEDNFNDTALKMFDVFNEKMIEQFARAIYFAIRGVKYDGLQKNVTVVKL